MKGICPNCEQETNIEPIRARETVEVRGEPIEIDAEYVTCNECGVDFENTRGPDALSLAYREYRRRHDMLQPENLRNWRKQQGLTQKELSDLLGWGSVTLSRYENGALQVEAHEKMLRLVMDPRNLIALIEETPDALPDEKRERLLAELTAADDEASSFERIFEERFAGYPPDEFSGFRTLDVHKLFNAILLFSSGGELKTKLNKLLFYADFKHFKEYAISITGARYVHLQYGPVPDNYDYYFAELERENALGLVEVEFGEYTGFKCSAIGDPDLEVFSKSELDVLEATKEHFSRLGSAEIMRASHKEAGYASTEEGERISYLYAEALSI